jgi:hypothetical protein
MSNANFNLTNDERLSMFRFGLAVACSSLLVLSGCATTDARILDSDQSQLQLRSIQTRAFDTPDRDLVLRNVIATLQDLGFVIDRADQTLGTVSATKLQGYQLKINVTARARGTTQTSVRANAEFNRKPVTEPKPYQDFFTSLEKSLFLTAQAVD